MYDTYQRIFTRCGLAFRAVEADTGNIGGSLSHEFQVLAETGEDALVACDSCDYAANVEQAVAPRAPKGDARRGGGDGQGRDPRHATASPTSPRSWACPRGKLVKTLIYLADGKPVAVLVRGDREVNEIKLKRALGADGSCCWPPTRRSREVTGAPVGFAGPVGLKVPVYCDVEICALGDFVRGRQRGRRAPGGRRHRARLHARPRAATTGPAAAGDACAALRRRATSSVYRGIEVGQVFFLGTKYSKPMKVNVPGRRRARRSPRRWAATASASPASSRPPSSRTTTRTASSGRCRWRRTRSTVLDLQQDDAERRRDRDAALRRAAAAGVEVLYDDRNERAGREVQGRRSDRHAVPHRGRQEGDRRGGGGGQAPRSAPRSGR